MPDQLFTQAIDLLHAGQPQQAESLCQQALEVDASNANMLGLLGVIQMKTGRPRAAEASLRKTIAIEPRFARPHEDLAILYMQQQNWVEAEIRARHMQMLNPDSTEIDQLIKSIKLNSGK